MRYLAYILGLALTISSCGSDENEDEAPKKAKIEESGGPCEYVDMPGKVITIEYYEDLGIIKGRFSANDPEHEKMLQNSYTNDTIFYYAQAGDKTETGSGIRVSMTVMVSGSCQPYPYQIETNDGTQRLLVSTDSLNNSTTDLKDK